MRNGTKKKKKRKVGSEFALPTAVSVVSEKAFVVTWVAYCVRTKQKAFCVAFSKH